MDIKDRKFSLKAPIWEFGQNGGIIRPMNRDVMFRNLVAIGTLLTKHKIRWWLSHGTMLGAYRENNFIEWDDDADIGLDMRDREKIYEVYKEARALGFFIPPEAKKDTTVVPDKAPYYDSVFIKQGEKIEGWWYDRKMIYNKKKKKKEYFYIYDEFRSGWSLKHPVKFYDELKTFKLRGTEFPCPNHIEGWLVHFYGEGWDTPDKKKKYNHHDHE